MRRFATDEVALRSAHIDTENEFPANLWEKTGNLELHGVMVSEEYGDAGGHPVYGR